MPSPGRAVPGWYYFTREFPYVKDGFWTPERMAQWNSFALLWSALYQEWIAPNRDAYIAKHTWRPDDATGF